MGGYVGYVICDEAIINFHVSGTAARTMPVLRIKIEDYTLEYSKQ
jgi:hypothetical protein